MPGRGVRQHLLDQADGLHGTQRLVVDADGARVVDQLIELLDLQHLHPGLAQVVGDRQPDRAGPDDHYVGGVVGLKLICLWRIHCCNPRHCPTAFPETPGKPLPSSRRQAQGSEWAFWLVRALAERCYASVR
ncbi:hypothetical protein D3C76_1248390 [compost metagenome]